MCWKGIVNNLNIMKKEDKAQVCHLIYHLLPSKYHDSKHNLIPEIMLKLTWGLGQGHIPEETEMGKSWIDSFTMLHTHIHLCDVKGMPVARHQT